ncbi:MAG TPA: endonuclease/exonuclease/phosphatase family protein, partial [Cryomorphaceae bacterium]|nr:endonuclease/exonuclease/phosphatase family protein [Cryomorphaceae bacterium]
MKLQLLIALFLLILPGVKTSGQDFRRYREAVNQERLEGDFRIGFYNVENLFDLESDSLKRDDAFTPEGSNRYTFGRYKEKSNGLSKTIAALGGWRPIEILGLCEVENKWVLDGLTVFSPLKTVEYGVIHEESPDRRGIDVACVYDPSRFNVILYKYFRINFPFDPDRKTRDMLYVKGILPNSDTLHVFINHWPSRYGGQFASEQSRNYVASVLRAKADSLNARFRNPLIVICGDFNDEPDDISLKDELQAKLSPEEAAGNDLINLMYPIKYKFGTHSFAGEWGVLDQFIVSRNLMENGQTFTRSSWVGIFDAPWLL